MFLVPIVFIAPRQLLILCAKKPRFKKSEMQGDLPSKEAPSAA